MPTEQKIANGTSERRSHELYAGFGLGMPTCPSTLEIFALNSTFSVFRLQYKTMELHSMINAFVLRGDITFLTQ
jgi:hypothetical protein